MSSNGQREAANVEQGVPLAEAFNLPTPPTPERQIDKLLVKISDDLNQLNTLANKSGAKHTIEAAKKYRAEHLTLGKKASQKKPSSSLVEEAVDLMLAVRSELSVPAREAGVNKALDAFKTHAGPAGRGQVGEFEREQQKIAKTKDPRKRCADYYELEREIIKADLRYQEQADPGSTWQRQVEYAEEDALPRNLAKEGAWMGAKVGFFVPLPGATLLGAAMGGLAGAILQSNEKPPLSAREWEQAGTSFAASMHRKIDDMAFSVPEASVDEFTTAAKVRIQTIQQAQFAPDKLPETQQQLGKALMVANMNALQSLVELKRDFPANATPQVFVKDGRMTVAKQAPKLESLVLQGGGGKGVGYPAMLEEMHKAGMLDSVDLLVGTSVGALNAACLACGGLADEREILNLKVTKEAYDQPGFKKKYPGVQFGGDIFPSCAGQMAKMDVMTSKAIGAKLQDRSEEQLTSELVTRLSDLDDEALARLGLAGADDARILQQVQALAKKVKRQDYSASDRTSQTITFKDLALLHQLDSKNFKELTITGWEGTGDKGHMVYFSAQDPKYCDMPIALAARISMGLPIISPVYWNGHGPFYDGGLGSNAPTEATPGLDKYYAEHGEIGVEEILQGDDVPLDLQQAMQKTMLMTFDDGGKANKTLHGEGRHTVAPDLGEKIAVLKKGQIGDAINPNFGQALKDDAGKIHNSGVNTFQVFHGNQGTLSLGPLGGSPEEIEYAENMARMKGLEQIDQRADQAVAVTCKSADEALATFSDAEKRQFVAAGPPHDPAPMARELFDKCVAYVALEGQCQAARNSGDATGLLLDLLASPLTANCRSEIGQLQGSYTVGCVGNPTPDQLQQQISQSVEAIKRLPLYLQAMLKVAVLVPLQKKARGLGRSASAEPDAALRSPNRTS